MEKSYNFIDVFSGCGGLSYGLEQVGFKCLLGIDHDKDAIETFKLNHEHAETYCGDVRELKNSMIKDLLQGQNIDLVVGGPPCQGFSTIGKGKSDDPRNFLFLEFVRIVRLTKPKSIVIENVTGLLASKNKEVLQNIFSIFEELGYQLDARVLSSDEYGVPEKRRRTIIIGCKNGMQPIFPTPSHGARGNKKVATVKDAFKSIRKSATYNDPATAQIKNELDRKRLKHIPEGCGIRYKKDQETYLPKSLHYDVIWEELREGRFRQTKLQRLSYSTPSFTILTSRTMYYHPTECRYLTAREAASIQSFPWNFNFVGSTTSVFKQIGNAVPVKMASAIGLALRESLSGKIVSLDQKKDFKRYAFHYNKEVAV